MPIVYVIFHNVVMPFHIKFDSSGQYTFYCSLLSSHPLSQYVAVNVKSMPGVGSFLY